MIHIKSILKNKEALLEHSLAGLEKMADDGRRERAIGLPIDFKGVDQGEHGHLRSHWEVNSNSRSGKKHKAVVEIHVPMQGGLFSVAKDKWNMKRFHRVLAKADVKVHCSCEDFYWSGMKYNTGPAGKLKGALAPNQNAGYKGEPNVVGNDLKPDVRDPERKNVLCMHLIALKNQLGWYVQDLMSAAKKYDNNIKINDEITKDLDDGKRALSKDVELVEVSDEETSEFMEPIIHAPEPDNLEKSQENDGSEEVIADDSMPDTSQEPEVDDVIDEESVPVEERMEEEKEEGAEEIIDEKNETVIEEEPEEEPEETPVLEKDKEDGEIDDPDEVLGR